MFYKKTLNIQKEGKKQNYVEIYIKEEGDLFFNNLNNDTVKLLQRISETTETVENIYCG